MSCSNISAGFTLDCNDAQGGVDKVFIANGPVEGITESSGLVGSDYVAAGPAGFIVAGTGLEDDMSTMKFFYDEGEDVVKFRAAWRLGIAVHQVNVFATNDLA